MRAAFRILLLASMLAAPLLAVGQVRAGADRFIGETPAYSSGAGLVLAIGLQRR